MGVIDDYIAPFPAPIRKLLKQMQRTIRDEAPAAVEAMSYGIPTFDVNGKHLVHFAGYPHHIGFYPGARVAAEFETEFSKYKSGKGSVQFPIDKPLPIELVRRVVRFRLAQSEPKAKVAVPKARTAATTKKTKEAVVGTSWPTLVTAWKAKAKVNAGPVSSLSAIRAAERKYGVLFPAEYVELLTTVGELVIDTGLERISVFGPKTFPSIVKSYRAELDEIADNTSAATVAAARDAIPLIAYRDTYPDGAFVVCPDGKTRDVSGKLLALQKPTPFRAALSRRVAALAKVKLRTKKPLLPLYEAICAAFPKVKHRAPYGDVTFLRMTLERTGKTNIEFAADVSHGRLEVELRGIPFNAKNDRLVEAFGRGSKDIEASLGGTLRVLRTFPDVAAVTPADLIATIKEAKALAKACR